MVSSTKPLLDTQGSLIDDIRVRFEGGRIVEAHAAPRKRRCCRS